VDEAGTTTVRTVINGAGGAWGWATPEALARIASAEPDDEPE